MIDQQPSTTRIRETPSRETADPPLPAAPGAAAAVLAAGVGSATLGVAIVLAEVSKPFAQALTFTGPVGPLSGKTTVAVAVWLVTWLVLAAAWRDREPAFGKAFAWALALIVAGLLLTFPPVFQAFAHH